MKWVIQALVVVVMGASIWMMAAATSNIGGDETQGPPGGGVLTPTVSDTTVTIVGAVIRCFQADQITVYMVSDSSSTDSTMTVQFSDNGTSGWTAAVTAIGADGSKASAFNNHYGFATADNYGAGADSLNLTGKVLTMVPIGGVVKTTAESSIFPAQGFAWKYCRFTAKFVLGSHGNIRMRHYVHYPTVETAISAQQQQ